MSDSNNMNDEIAAAEAALKEAQERLRVAREKQAQGGQPGESGEAGEACQPGDANPAEQQGEAPFSDQQQAGRPDSSQDSQGSWGQACQQPSGAWGQPGQNPWQACGQTYQQGQDVWGQAYQQPGGQTYQQAQDFWQANQAYSQPYGQPYQQPYAQAAPNTKDHVAAGLLAIFLGSLGIHKFYLGYNTPGFIMLAVTIVGSIFSLGIAGLAMVVISIVEGVLYLSKSQTEFEQVYVFNKKEWF